jgi:hypothetical protein
MRLAAFIGTLALATALGAVLLCELVVVPGLATQTHLVDANLATALTGPLHLRMGEIVLAAALVLAAVVPRWLGSRRASALTLLTLFVAAVQRVFVVPAVYAAWSRVDRVAGRPVERLLEAQRLTDQAHWVAAAMLLLLTGLAWFAATRSPATVESQTTASTQAATRSSRGEPAVC